jgi:DNA polymerase-3 subunit alpha
VKVAGCVIASKERPTRTGGRMAWIRLSDGSGSFEVTAFSEVLGAARDALRPGNPVLMSVDLRLDGDTLRVTAADCTSLDVAAEAAGAGMRIWLDRTEAVPHIRAILARENRGRGRVTLVPRLGSEQAVEITLPGGFKVTPHLAQAIKILPGVERVEEV